jgi:ketosteroid isomerase-like protein
MVGALGAAFGLLALGAQTPAQRESLLVRDRATAAAVARDGFALGLPPALGADMILLLDGAPIVRGRDEAARWLAAQAELRAARVQWQPLAAIIAADASLGVTYGVTTIARDSLPLRFGKYVTIWRREAGEWREAVQVFTALLQRPERPAGDPPPPAPRRPEGPFADADRAFARMAADSGAAAAFGAFAAPTGVIFPATGELVIGPDAIRARLREGRARTAWVWAPVVAGSSEAGDLGFTVGEATIRSTVDTTTSTFHSKYLTVWRRTPDGSIRFLVDAGNARPPGTP